MTTQERKPKLFRPPLAVRMLFKSPTTIGDGRQQFMDWVKTQTMRAGDRIYIPDIGGKPQWATKDKDDIVN